MKAKKLDIDHLLCLFWGHGPMRLREEETIAVVSCERCHRDVDVFSRVVRERDNEG